MITFNIQNGGQGPGCSSVGIGALAEHGPFGVNWDGRTTLYSRTHSWNKDTNSTIKSESIADPGEKRYVSMYLNLPQVQRSLHANKTKLPYAWGLCSSVIVKWMNSLYTILPLYQKLITKGLRILLYRLLLLMSGFSLFILSSSFHSTVRYNGDQVAFLKALITSNIQNGGQGVDWKATSYADEHVMRVLSDLDTGSTDDDLIVRGLPEQPLDVKFKQFAGDVVVDEAHGINLFYYFVEAAYEISTSEPLVLWLNGGPGCSSVGIGALAEHEPFGVKWDGRTTLYSRTHSWNKLANILHLESPAGVGFSYSNTSSDYDKTGDSSTGYYIPELDTIRSTYPPFFSN